MISSKVRHLFETNEVKLARLHHCMTQWWTRGSNRTEICDSLASLKSELKWDIAIDGRNIEAPWLDRNDISSFSFFRKHHKTGREHIVASFTYESIDDILVAQLKPLKAEVGPQP